MSGAAIEVDGLVRRFGSFTAVDRVTFDVRRGEIFGFLGANGAGKSTVIRMLCALLAPTSGSARVVGHDVATERNSVQSSIGYMSQKFSLYGDLTVAENLEFFGGAYALSRSHLATRIDALLEDTGLASQRNDRTSLLPGGTRQRLALACALVHEPKVVFLDEPTAGVDPMARQRFFELIRRLAAGGTTVFVTTHHLDEAEHCHRVGLMVRGRLVALGAPDALETEHVPGAMLSVHGEAIDRVLVLLRSIDGVRHVERFGAGLHVRVDEARFDETSLASLLETHLGGTYEVERESPSLEDVFLKVVASESGNGGP